MKKYAKYILLFLAFIGVVVVGIFLNIQSESSTEYDIPQYVSGYPLAFKVEKDEFPEVPDTLPIITIEQSKLSIDDAQEIADYFRFDNEPKASTDSFRGEFLLWVDKNRSLTVFLESPAISYSNEVGLILSETDNNPESVVNQLISSLFNTISINPLGLKVQSVEYYNSPEFGEHLSPASQSSYDTSLVKLQPSNLSIPMVGFIPQTSPSMVWVDDLGKVRKVEIVILKSLQEEEPQRILGFDYLVDNYQKASLRELDNGNLSIFNLDPGTIKNITINSVELAYFSSESSSKFIPIYLLNGVAEIQSDQKVEASLYIPAFR